MFRINVYCTLLLFITSCSSNKEWDSSSVSSAMKTMEKERKVDYSPSKKENTAFIDKTESFGLAAAEATNIKVVDLNNDNYSDLVLIEDYFSQPVFYFYNSKLSKFEKRESLFDNPPKASFVLFYDFNGDQIKDALIGVLNQKTEISKRPLRLYEGYYKKGQLRFREEANAFNIKAMPTSTVGIIDYDLDGDLDIFMGNWFEYVKRGVIPAKDLLLKNENGRFSDVSELLVGENQFNSDKTMRVNAIPTFSSQICDMDQNGFPDILAVGTHSYLNKLWLNRYTSKENKRLFRDYGVGSLFAGDPEGNLSSRGGGRTFSVACADYNHDGIMDAFMGELSHNYDSDVVDKSSVLTGSSAKFPPKFIRTEYQLDAHDLRWNQSDRRGVWFDYNNDGLLDLLVDNSGYPPHTRMLLFKQHPDHSFENVGKEVGLDIVNPISSVILDVNKDGKMDVLTAQSELRDARIKKRLYLFINEDKNPNSSVRIFLEGKQSNSKGVNASIILKVLKNSKIENRTQQVNYSYGGLVPQNEEGILFGLGQSEKLISAKVIWPYSKSLNASRAGMEKVYKFKNVDVKRNPSLTLCESGKVLVGRGKCPRF
ncbi:MAG: VCBS repeat-containing protein [Bacteriovoracaceae bacterium]|nr:VCBS repeat-containing protein [Bacteriovoracaceae bacterium]